MNCSARAWNISIKEYYGDRELRSAFDSIIKIMGNAPRSLDARIFSELARRSQCGCSTEEGHLKMAEIRNKMMFQRDYEAYKKANS